MIFNVIYSSCFINIMNDYWILMRFEGLRVWGIIYEKRNNLENYAFQLLFLSRPIIYWLYSSTFSRIFRYMLGGHYFMRYQNAHMCFENAFIIYYMIQTKKNPNLTFSLFSWPQYNHFILHNSYLLLRFMSFSDLIHEVIDSVKHAFETYKK